MWKENSGSIITKQQKIADMFMRKFILLGYVMMICNPNRSNQEFKDHLENLRKDEREEREVRFGIE